MWLVSCFPLEMNRRTARWLGSFWWAISRKHRERALGHLRSALGAEYSEAQLTRIARGSFQHFAQLYLVELIFTPRVMTLWSWQRYVELEDTRRAIEALLTPRGALLITPHFGNYELIGFTLCRLGFPTTAIMRPLDNPLVNAFLVRTRAAAGLRLIDKKGASAQAGPLLQAGGLLGFIGDQDAGRKAIFAEFFGMPASTYKSIGLLAMSYEAPIIVGAAIRTGERFHYRLVLDRLIEPEEWQSLSDPLTWITQEFSRAMERCVRRAPEQYLWLHRRWKHQPPARTAGRDAAPPAEAPSATAAPASPSAGALTTP